MKSSFITFSPTYPSKKLRFNGPSFSKMIMMMMMMMMMKKKKKKKMMMMINK
jgi:hypothetical protein